MIKHSVHVRVPSLGRSRRAAVRATVLSVQQRPRLHPHRSAERRPGAPSKVWLPSPDVQRHLTVLHHDCGRPKVVTAFVAHDCEVLGRDAKRDGLLLAWRAKSARRTCGAGTVAFGVFT